MAHWLRTLERTHVGYQHSHGSSELSALQFLGDLMLFLAFVSTKQKIHIQMLM